MSVLIVNNSNVIEQWFISQSSFRFTYDISIVSQKWF